MKTMSWSNSLAMAALTAVLAGGPAVRASTPPATPWADPSGTSPGAFQFVAFPNSVEADMLRSAYRTLATGDHDYRGHRVKGMRALEAAGKLLGMDLSGDLRDRTPQPLSDEKLREAQGLITRVLGSAEVKGQKRVVKHLSVAIQQIDIALSTR